MRDYIVAVLLSVSLATTGCASSRGYGQAAPVPTPKPGAEVMAAYVRQLPVGTRVRVTLADGRTLDGTLMSTGDPLVLQKRTRIPESPVEIAVQSVRAVEPASKSGGAGRAIALGAAAGAASALGVLMVLAAIFAD
jgi:hypothetical protein